MKRKVDRRCFLTTATVAGASLLRFSQSADCAPRPERRNAIPIVDTHQHIWDLSKFKLAWQANEEYRPLARNFLLKDYAKATEGLDVVKTVYMEVDVPVEQQSAEAEYVIELCKQTDNRVVAAVISGRPSTDLFEPYVQRFAKSPYIKGVRDILWGKDPDYFLGRQYLQGIRLLGDLGMRFDIEIQSSGLPAAAKLIKACPATRFIIDHCGNPDMKSEDISTWRRDVGVIAKHENVVVKISGLLSNVKDESWKPEDLAPVINHLWEVFGTDRVMFGSDWPVCTLKGSYRRWFDAVQTVVGDRSEADQRRLFHDNALRVYQLT
ncbi:MAG: amidohydrolase family protein [Pirellulaceae bacterium]|nr:amidohydrolase family protein [Pirellulaceae bacterium]